MACDLMQLDLVTLTLLRDPVDRTISVLKHFKRLFAPYRELSLAQIYEDEFVFRHFVENHQTRIFALTPDDRPQAFASNLSYREILAALDVPATRAAGAARATIATNEQRLDLAKSNLDRVDVVGLSEDYPGFVTEMQERFGWWGAGVDLGARANVSTESWDSEPSLRRRIAADNPFDLELYEHARRLVARRRQ
jgi:hypothetical protein